jgi:hypothetical protein
MKKIIFLMAAVLAAVTLLAAGLIVFPGPVQETQANPCSTSAYSDSALGDVDDDLNCDFTGTGSLEIDEGGSMQVLTD